MGQAQRQRYFRKGFETLLPSMKFMIDWLSLVPLTELRKCINRETLFKSPPENLPVVPWSKDEAFRENICTTFGKISFVNNDNAKPAKVTALSILEQLEYIIFSFLK